MLYATCTPTLVNLKSRSGILAGPLAGTLPIAQRLSAATCIQELLTPNKPATACDRAAFVRLTAHMSHELRTPLNAILGFSELMSNEVFGPLGSTAYAAYARDIHASGISLLKSADDALAITNLLTAPDQTHRAAVTNAAAAAAEALAFHANYFAARNITAACTIDGNADLIADPQAARQLLINLIADASQRVEPGSRLSIASRTGDGQIEILVTVAGRMTINAGLTESFSMLLARTLSELSGATLTADAPPTDETSAWQISARFNRAAQDDFFTQARHQPAG